VAPSRTARALCGARVPNNALPATKGHHEVRYVLGHFKGVSEVELEKASAELQAALMRGKFPDATGRTTILLATEEMVRKA
jgi:hypothetical protein